MCLSVCLLVCKQLQQFALMQQQQQQYAAMPNEAITGDVM